MVDNSLYTINLDRKLNSKEKIALIDDPNTPDGVLSQLASDKDFSVRRALAMRREPLSRQLLDLLVTDTSLNTSLSKRKDLPVHIKDILLARGIAVLQTIDGIVERLTIRHGWVMATEYYANHYFFDKEFSINGVTWQFAQNWKVDGYGIVPKEAIRLEETFHEGDKIRVTYKETKDTIEVIQIDLIESSR